MDPLDRFFQQFLRERTYINNVTSSTCEWYVSAWKAFKGSQADARTVPDSDGPIIYAAER